MLTAVIAEAIVTLVVASALLRHISNLTRAHARREDLLVNQLCNLAGRPWQSAPSTREIEDEPEPEFPTLISNPEQYPGYV